MSLILGDYRETEVTKLAHKGLSILPYLNVNRNYFFKNIAVDYLLVNGHMFHKFLKVFKILAHHVHLALPRVTGP